jgi:hypothetical protein
LEEQRLKIFENTVSRGIFGPNWDELITNSFIMNQTRNGENYMMINLVLCVSSRTVNGLNPEFWNGLSQKYA